MMMKKQNIRTIALIVCTFTYLLGGAAIFDALESGNEQDERKRFKGEELQIQAKYNISDQDMATLKINIIRSKPYRAGTQWKFSGAFYFALSVITTIGYGHSTPRTDGGKVFCIFYALIGIPLNIVMFQSIGERFNIGITVVVKRVKRCLRLKRKSVSETELTILASILCISVLFGGAGAFHYFENWGFVDAFYYCFITMSTIGFGDYVALQNATMQALQYQPEYVAFSIIYILFGLTVFAAALNLMVLRLLTMNTEDERKDEFQALVAARNAVKVDGDVITPGAKNNGMTSLSDEEGVQIEADAPLTDLSTQFTRSKPASNPRHFYGITNGILTNHSNRLGSVGRRATGIFNNILHKPSHSYRPTRAILWADTNDHHHQVLLNRPEDNGSVPGSNYLHKKRCSV